MALLATATDAEHGTRHSGLSAVARLLAWRREPGFGWPESATLAVFFSIAAYTLHYHEKWADEAQAWLIARDNSVLRIVRHRLHYEGAPPAWPLLMHAFHRLGGTYAGLGWLSLAIAMAGVYVWLRWSPFPPVIRYSFPFTFFILYQYAVIARPYVLFPLLSFSLCVLHKRKSKVVWYALAAGLLANLSLQGFMASLAFCGLYVFDAYKMRRRSDAAWERGRARAVRRRQTTAAALFAAMACTAVYCAIPAPDLSFMIGDDVSSGWAHTVLLRIVGETPRNVPNPPRDEPRGRAGLCRTSQMKRCGRWLTRIFLRAHSYRRRCYG